MVDDASLDDFVNADDETSEARSASERERGGTTRERSGTASDGDGARASDEGDAEEATVSPDSVEPAVSTAAWTTDGAECASCGDAVERRWREDDRFVCAACRDW